MIILKEFAIERSALKASLMSDFKQIFPHLLLVFYYPIAQEVNHWKGEIYNFLNDVPLLKSTKRLPKKDLIFDGLWTSVEERIPSRHRNFIRDVNEGVYGEGLGNITYDPRAEEFCRKYITWLSEQLSTLGELSRSSVLKEIDRLIGEYKRKTS